MPHGRRSQRVSFPGGSGFELSGILDQPDGEPRGVALFTHCFTCNKDLKAIVRIGRGLAEQGFAVLRYDLTGLGNSQGDFSHTNFSTNQADLKAAVQFLEGTLRSPDVLIGHSFGGACSLSLAQSIASVRGVVSLAAPSDTDHLADLLERMQASIKASGQGTVNIGGREYLIREQMLHDFRQHDLPATLRRLEKPVLLFHSPEDETLDFGHVLRLYSLLTQRNVGDPPPSPASLICLPGADHLLVKQSADLSFVVSSIAAWFERQMADV